MSNFNSNNNNNDNKDYSVFEKRKNKNLTFSGSEAFSNTKENLKESVGNIFGKFKSYVKVPNDEEADLNLEKKEENNKNFIEKLKENISNLIEVEKSYKFFFVFFSVGIGIIFFSLLFLPIVVLAPTKFVSLFSLGSLVTLISFVFLYGTKEYLGMLFSSERYLFTLLFLFSIFIGIYFAVVNPYFLVALICAGIQFVTLLIFSLSFIPGGGMGISFISSVLLSPFKKIFGKFTGN